MQGRRARPPPKRRPCGRRQPTGAAAARARRPWRRGGPAAPRSAFAANSVVAGRRLVGLRDVGQAAQRGGARVLASCLAPVRVAYVESNEVAAPASDVYDAIRLQGRLMRWSVWPRETRSTCAVEGEDGAVGARTAFFSKDRRVGFQEIVALEPDRVVAFRLEGAGPPHRPTLRFELRETAPGRTRVDLRFENRFPRPFNLIWTWGGLSRWTRRMHVMDLAGLKAFAEPPHRDALGRVVGPRPTLPNPFERAA